MILIMLDMFCDRLSTGERGKLQKKIVRTLAPD